MLWCLGGGFKKFGTWWRFGFLGSIKKLVWGLLRVQALLLLSDSDSILRVCERIVVCDFDEKKRYRL